MTTRDPDELIRIGQLIDVALDVAPDERRALLTRACGSDTALFDVVWRVLTDLDGDSEFLETPAVLSLLPTSADTTEDDHDYQDSLHALPPSSNEDDTRDSRPPAIPRPPRSRARFVRHHAPMISVIALGVAGVIAVLWDGRLRSGSLETTSRAETDSSLQSEGRRADFPNAARGESRSAQSDEARAAIRQLELGRALIQRGSYDAAEVSLRAAMALFTAASDETSLESADARCLLANMLERRNRLVEAERELRAGLHVYRMLLTADDPRIERALSSLIELLTKAGRQAEADSLRNAVIQAPHAESLAPNTA